MKERTSMNTEIKPVVSAGGLRAKVLLVVVSIGFMITAAAGQGRPPILWSAAGHSGTVTAVEVSPDGTLLATSSGDATVKLWRYSDGALVRTLVVPYDINEQVTEISG